MGAKASKSGEESLHEGDSSDFRVSRLYFSAVAVLPEEGKEKKKKKETEKTGSREALRSRRVLSSEDVPASEL